MCVVTDKKWKHKASVCLWQAVPLAEPEWSAAYKGLCMYVARVLQPAWEEAVTVPVSRGSSQQKANIPTDTLQVAASFQHFCASQQSAYFLYRISRNRRNIWASLGFQTR